MRKFIISILMLASLAPITLLSATGPAAAGGLKVVRPDGGVGAGKPQFNDGGQPGPQSLPGPVFGGPPGTNGGGKPIVKHIRR
jgi:hypothetical protein